MNERQKRVQAVEPQRCPRRAEGLGMMNKDTTPDQWEIGRWAATQQEADAEVAEFMAAHGANGGSMGNPLWPGPGSQPRTCSYCGGIHPEDAITLMTSGAWRAECTDKRYKWYLEPKTVGVYPLPPVKLYVQHFTQDHIDRFNAALRAG